MISFRRTSRGNRVIGVLGVLLALAGGSAHAANVKFTAEADRSEVFQDESVSVKLSVEVDGALSTGQPELDAPDFDVLNTYQSTYMQSYYENGRFGVRNTLQVTKVLRPLKTGRLTIRNIRITVGGSSYRSPDITVSVLPAGQGTPPPGNYGGTIGLRGAGRRIAKKPIILRAEVSKPEVYKGEQLIVSYYLYRTVRVFNVQVVKFPVLEGFLREDLDLPVVRGTMDWEPVTLDGVAYQRTLLARYAAYPLQDGTLAIDRMTIKANYYGEDDAGPSDSDDPFLQFFQQMTPRTSQEKNEAVSVRVNPLPENGKSASFKGAVGEFSAIAAVDKYQVRANEPVTLTVKVEGRGNVSAFGEPEAKWPDGVDLYEAKGRAKSGRGGIGQKVFEFLLIPRQPGTLTLPPLEFSFFQPDRKEYVTISTQPVTLEVGAPAPGSAIVSQAPKVSSSAGSGKSAAPAAPAEDIRYLKPPGADATGIAGVTWWRWSYWLGLGALLLFSAWVASDQLGIARERKGASTRAGKAREERWEKIKSKARELGSGQAWEGLAQAYTELSDALLEEIQRGTGLAARSYSREDLRRMLVDERGMDASLWSSIERLLEYCEAVRFGSSNGWIDPAEARQKFSATAREGELIAQRLMRDSVPPPNAP